MREVQVRQAGVSRLKSVGRTQPTRTHRARRPAGRRANHPATVTRRTTDYESCMSKAEKKAAQAAALNQERIRSQKIKSALYKECGSPRDILEDFESLLTLEKDGLKYSLFFTCSEHPTWNAALSTFVLDLTRANMKEIYEGAEGWGWKEGKKRAELNDEKNRFVMIRYEGGGEAGGPLSPGDILGFVSFRFLIEADFEALYVFELQLGQHSQRKGFGRHLMNLCDLIAKKHGMH